MSEDRNETSFSFESPQQHSPRPSSSTLVLDSTPAPQTSALAKAEEIAAHWYSKVEEYQDICMRLDAKGHNRSSATAEERQAYQDARVAGREYAAQHAEAVERLLLLRNLAVSPHSVWWVIYDSTHYGPGSPSAFRDTDRSTPNPLRAIPSE